MQCGARLASAGSVVSATRGRAVSRGQQQTHLRRDLVPRSADGHREPVLLRRAAERRPLDTVMTQHPPRAPLADGNSPGHAIVKRRLAITHARTTQPHLQRPARAAPAPNQAIPAAASPAAPSRTNRRSTRVVNRACRARPGQRAMFPQGYSCRSGSVRTGVRPAGDQKPGIGRPSGDTVSGPGAGVVNLTRAAPRTSGNGTLRCTGTGRSQRAVRAAGTWGLTRSRSAARPASGRTS